MKKAMAKHLLRLFAALFVLFSTWTFSATEAAAQATDIALLNQSQNLNWVSEAEAMAVLEAQLITLADQLAAQPQGSQAYKNILNHLVYYKLIYNDIESGVSTMLATNGNLINVSSQNNSKDDASSPINLNQLYLDAVGLLTT